MYAIIKTGGKQYKVGPGDEISVEKVQGQAGDTVTFDQVLAVSDGQELKVGKPILENTKVVARIVRQIKDKKIIVFKYKRRKGYKKKRGHRQFLSIVKIEQIEA